MGKLSRTLSVRTTASCGKQRVLTLILEQNPGEVQSKTLPMAVSFPAAEDDSLISYHDSYQGSVWC